MTDKEKACRSCSFWRGTKYWGDIDGVRCGKCLNKHYSAIVTTERYLCKYYRKSMEGEE